MSDQPRRERTPGKPTAAPARRAGVPIARGVERALLERVIEALESAGIPYAVEDQIAGETAGTWQVLVPMLQAPRALAAIAALRSGAPEPPHPHTPSEGRPLFVSQPIDGLRLLLMLACFAAALWLALRG